MSPSNLNYRSRNDIDISRVSNSRVKSSLIFGFLLATNDENSDRDFLSIFS